MSKYDFHIPFLQSLVIIAAVTLVSMSIAHILIPDLINSYQKSPQYTTSHSYSEAKAGE